MVRMFRWPSSLLMVSMATPCDSVIVVANVWRATWKVIGRTIGEQPAQAGVAPAVARQGENRFVGRVRQVPGQDGVRNGEKPDIHLRTGLAACRADPELSLRIADIRGL